MMALSSRPWARIGCGSLLCLACVLASRASTQAVGEPPTDWVASVTRSAVTSGIKTTPDGFWTASCAESTGATSSRDSLQTSFRKAAAKAKAEMIQHRAGQLLALEPAFRRQPAPVQKALAALARRAAASGTVTGAWTAFEAQVGEDRRGRPIAKVVVIAPTTGIACGLPPIDELLGIVSRSADNPESLGATLLWTALHSGKAAEAKMRLTQALRASGLNQLAAAVLHEPVTEALPTLPAPDGASLADCLKAANRDPYNPATILPLVNRLQTDGYDTAGKIIAVAGTYSWCDARAQTECAGIAGITPPMLPTSTTAEALLRRPELAVNSRARVAIRHGGRIPWVPGGEDRQARLQKPTRLSYAIGEFENQPSQGTAWALLVALDTHDPAIGDALFRQASLDGGLSSQ